VSDRVEGRGGDGTGRGCGNILSRASSWCGCVPGPLGEFAFRVGTG